MCLIFSIQEVKHDEIDVQTKTFPIDLGRYKN